MSPRGRASFKVSGIFVCPRKLDLKSRSYPGLALLMIIAPGER